MRREDANSLVEWLNQAEEETKATIAEQERIDPYHDGVLSSIQTFREYIKKIYKVEEMMSEMSRLRPIGTIGGRLKYLRQTRMLKREDVAEKTGISEDRLLEIERGRKGLEFGEAIKFADLYKVPLDYIAGRDERI